jgi:hypothetical protein
MWFRIELIENFFYVILISFKKNFFCLTSSLLGFH